MIQIGWCLELYNARSRTARAQHDNNMILSVLRGAHSRCSQTVQWLITPEVIDASFRSLYYNQDIVKSRKKGLLACEKTRNITYNKHILLRVWLNALFHSPCYNTKYIPGMLVINNTKYLVYAYVRSKRPPFTNRRYRLQHRKTTTPWTIDNSPIVYQQFPPAIDCLLWSVIPLN